MRYLLIRVATRKMLANLAVFGVVFSMLAPSPIERGADCDTERYPYGLSGKHKSNRTYSCARAYPVTSNARVSGFFIHGMLRPTSFNRHAFSQVARLVDVGAPRHGHVIRQ